MFVPAYHGAFSNASEQLVSRELKISFFYFTEEEREAQ
jgi:hypothetical protein